MTMFTGYIVWDGKLYCNQKDACESPLLLADDAGEIGLADCINAAQEHEREVHRSNGG